MNRSSSLLMVQLLVLLLFSVGACAPHRVADPDPCVSANAPITLDNLVRNSASQSYERCLALIRDIAATELRD